jgi:mannose-6-phosphate isomerase
VNPEPFRIEPTFVPRIWGSRSLAPIYPEKSSLDVPIGEAWLTGADCRIASGPFAGKRLGEAWKEMPADWRGDDLWKPSDFPLLVKFIFPTDNLSIQVHPDDAYAAVHEHAAGGRGKTEMWHVVYAEPGARLLLGLKPGVTKEAFRQALNSQDLEDLFQSHEVHPGGTFFIPAGTPHTIGPGMIICEVQQYSDLTYRVYDYGRVDAHGKPREMHVEKALAVTDFNGTKGGVVEPLRWSGREIENSLLVVCRYFAVERWEVREPIPVFRDKKRFHLLVFLSGRGKLEWETGQALFNQGECWLIPSSLDGFQLLPELETSLIRIFVPDLKTVRESFRIFGISGAQISRIVFE